MTVLKVTNATLKGSVKGPTFTGTVDGSTFSGDVTYTDTTEPPIEPPPTGNTKGLIANFNETTGNTNMTIGGRATKNLNCNGSASSNNSWSINKVDDYTIKYEVRSGDRATSVGGSWNDPTTSERSETEFAKRYAQGELFTVEYTYVMHPGSPNTSQWMLNGQFHFDKGSGSPPVGVAFFGEKMTIIVRGPDNRENRVWTDPNPIQRGKKYAMKLEIKINAGGTGTCKVWRDGVQIVNHSGALGSGVNGDTHYWKQGIYRNEAQESISASYSNTSPS